MLWFALVFANSADAAPKVQATLTLPSIAHGLAVPLDAFVWPTGPEGACELAMVTVTPTELQFGNRTVATLDKARFADADVRGEHFVAPLYDALLKAAEALKYGEASCGAEQQPFSGRLVVAVDAGVPAWTVKQLVYTAGQAQFSEVHFVGDGPGEKRTPGTLTADSAASSFVLERAGVRMLEDADVARLGCAFAFVSTSVSWNATVQAFDEAAGRGADTLYLGLGPDDADPAVTPLPGAPVKWSAKDTPAALRVTALPLGVVAAEVKGGPCDVDRVVPAAEAKLRPAPEPNAGVGGLGAKDGYLSAVPSDVFPQPPPPRFRVDWDAADFGGFDPARVKEILRRSQGQLRYCHERSLTKDPDIRGDLTVTFAVDATGAVSDVRAASGSLTHEPTRTCVLGRFPRMQFPEPADAPVTLGIPMSFGE